MSLVVVTGATGNAGGAVVDALRHGDHVVRALIHSDTDSLPDVVERIVGDLDDAATVAPGLIGADALFLLAGYDGEQKLLAVAADAGVGRVVLLSGGGAGSKDPDNVISRFQLAAESRVKESGMDWTILRPHGFFTNVFRWPAIPGGGVVRAPFADVPTSAIDPADIGAVAAIALTEPGHSGQTYELSGPESLRPADQVATLASVAGIDLTFETQPDDEAREEMSSTMPVEYVDAFFSFYHDGNLDESAVLPTVEQVTGRPPRTFADWVAANTDRLRG
jgi:uncharacterized protein YbjT (DUF2867 family)